MGVLAVSGSGSVRKTLSNASIALRVCDDVSGRFFYDEHRGRVFVTAELPWSRHVNRAWTQHDDVAAAIWMEEAGLPMSVGAVSEAVQHVAYQRRVHPLRSWLEGLVWDGRLRLDTWLSYYLGCEPSSYTAAVGRKFLIQAVARVMSPGCKADYTMILEGSQGTGKSTAIRTLASDQYFTDEICDFGSRDAVDQMQGMWIIELAELDMLSRAEAARAKAFLSRSRDRARLAYGRRTEEFPRQCVFVGSTNHDSYLKDETGNRRFWPVKCGASIDIEALASDRAQLWAEAVAAYHSGERWWFSRDDDVSPDQEQETRMEVDPWHDLIAQWIGVNITPGEILRIDAVLEKCIGMPVKDRTKVDTNRVGKVLRALGWERKAIWRDGKTVKIWTLPMPLT